MIEMITKPPDFDPITEGAVAMTLSNGVCYSWVCVNHLDVGLIWQISGSRLVGTTYTYDTAGTAIIIDDAPLLEREIKSII